MGSCCDKEPEMLHALQKKHGKVLWVVLAINLIMFAAELITGYLAGSTAVLADSLDMLGDSLVYGFGIFALGRSQVWQVRVSRMKGLIMFGFGCAVIVQAIYKFAQISIPDAELMGWIGLLALTMNAICFGLLWGHRSDNINMQSTWICSRNDLIANVGVGEHKKAWGLCCLSTWIPPFKSLLKLPVKNLGPRLQQQMRAGF